jgi:hypothetical protein
MQQAYIVTGSVVDGQTLKLDEALPIRDARVRVSVEVLSTPAGTTLAQVLAEIHQGQRQRGFVPPTRDVVDACLEAERESWGDA